MQMNRRNSFSSARNLKMQACPCFRVPAEMPSIFTSLLGSSGLRYIWVNLYHRITVWLYMCMHMKQNTYDYTVNTWFQQRTRQGRVTVVSKQLCSSSYVWIIDSNASGSLIVPFAGANTGAGERSHLHMRLRAALRAEKSRVIAKVCWFYY